MIQSGHLWGLLLTLLLLGLLGDETGAEEAIAPAGTIQTLSKCPEDLKQSCIRFGVSFSLTGKYQASGSAARDGLLLFAELANGKAETRKMEKEIFEGSRFVADAPNYGVEVRFLDDRSEQEGVEAAYALLAKDPEVDFLLGPYGSTFGRAAAGIAEENSRAIVLPMSATDSVYSETQPHVVGLFTPTSRYMSDMVALLKKAGAQKAVMLHSENFFAKSVAKSATAACQAEGIEITATETYAAEVPDGEEPGKRIEEALKKLCSGEPEAGPTHPDVLFIHALKHEGTPILYALENAGCMLHKATVLTSAASDDNWVMEKRQEAGRLCLLGSAQWRAMEGWSDPFLGSSVLLAQLYRQRYAVEMRYEAAATMASALLVLEAHLQVEGRGRRLADTMERQTAVLEAIRNFEGTTFFGPIKFDATGKNVGKPMLTTQVQGSGAIRAVAPEAQRDAELIYPCPASQPGQGEQKDKETSQSQKKELLPGIPSWLFLGLATLMAMPQAG